MKLERWCKEHRCDEERAYNIEDVGAKIKNMRNEDKVQQKVRGQKNTEHI